MSAGAITTHVLPRAATGRRIDALDVARGVALIAMTVYHFAWDLAFFGYVAAADLRTTGWILFARTIATAFLFLVGVSLVLAHGRALRPRAFLVRLAQIAAGAAAVSLATYLFVPGGFIFFGILHAIALFSVLALPFLRLPWPVAALAGGAVLWIGNTIAHPLFETPWTWWIGLAPAPPVSNDYVPLFPFLAPVLFGVAFARVAPVLGLWDALRAWNGRAQPLAWLGRHSLAYYLAHQPVLFGLVAGVAWVTGGPDRTAEYRAAWTAECRTETAASGSTLACEPYVACVIEGAERETLFTAVTRDALDDGQRARLNEIIAGCVADNTR